jgi:hypothetical protein
MDGFHREENGFTRGNPFIDQHVTEPSAQGCQVDVNLPYHDSCICHGGVPLKGSNMPRSERRETIETTLATPGHAVPCRALPRSIM